MSSSVMGGGAPTVLRDAFKAHAPEYRRAIYYSLVIGVLSLSSTVFMLEVYDRVVNSRSVMTLAMLIVAVVAAATLPMRDNTATTSWPCQCPQAMAVRTTPHHQGFRV